MLLRAFALLLLAAPVRSEPVPRVTVRVVVEGLRASSGLVGCLLFKGGEGFPGDWAKASQRVFVEASGDTATCVMEGVTPGEYAVSVLHDENANRRLDTNFLGIPREGYGFSNRAQAGWFGPPAFEAARVVVGGDADVPVNLIY